MRVVKGQKIVQNDKKLCLSHSIFQEPYIIWSSFVVCKCKMISLGVFFIFYLFIYFFNLIFQAVKEVKGQKVVQNDKKLCLSHSIFQEPYIIWSSFLVWKCKMIISSGVFFIFSKFWFFRLLGRLKGKKCPKMTKNSVCHALYLRNCTSYDLHLWYTCVIG